MNMKKTVKKITAVLTGATMLGATVMGAMADLGNFPAPVIEDGVWNGRIVIGEHAGSTLDVAGATEIGAALPELGKVPVSIGGGVITVEGGELLEEDLNAPFDLGTTGLDYRKLDGFADDEFTIGSKRITYREYMWASEGALEVVTSSVTTNEDMGAHPFLTLDDKTGIKYFVEFRNNLLLDGDFTDVAGDALTADFEILGSSVKITAIDELEQTVTLEASTTAVMEVGDSRVVDGRTVTLDRVGASSVLVTVDGQTLPVSGTSTQTFNQAGNFKVRLDSVFYEEGAANNLAVLELGDSLSSTISDGEAATLFGEVDDDNEATWTWYLEFDEDDDGLKRIGVQSNQDRDKVSVTRARERPALAVGDSIALPNNYAEIEFVGLSISEYYDLTIDLTTMDFEADEGEEEYDGFVVEFHIEGGDFFELDDGAHTTNTVYYALDDDGGDTGWWYFDGNEEVYVGNVTLELVIDDEVTITIAEDFGVEGEEGSLFFDVWNIQFVEMGIVLFFNEDVEEFENVDGEQRDYLWADASNIGRLDYDILTTYGVVIEDPDSQYQDNRFVMSVPAEAQEAHVLVKSLHTDYTEGEAGVGYRYPTKPTNVMMLDTEAINRIGTIPMIVVGGPNANVVAARLLEVEAFSADVNEMFSPGRAMIRLFDEDNAILVAGYSAQDTYAASLALANFEKDQFEGYNEVEVIVAATGTVSNIVGAN